jgi:hypothetical protein
MAELFKNNVSVLLAGAINASQTTITVNDGSLLPSPSGGDFFRLTLIERNTNEIDWEIVKVSARSGNDLTVLRGQEGTTARTWADLTRCEMRATAGALEALAANTMKTDVAQTVTAAKSFNDATMILKGSTSGTTTLKAAAEAGTGEVNFPTTGTLATTSQLLGGFKNKIINGDFSVWQRGTDFANLQIGAFCADRWLLFTSSNAFARTLGVSYHFDPAIPFPHQRYAKLSYTNVTGPFADYFTTRIEKAQTLSGKTVTLSCYASTDVPSNAQLDCVVCQKFGVGGSADVVVVDGAELSLTNVPTRLSWTFTVPLCSGKTFGPGHFLEVNLRPFVSGNCVIYITGVQLEEGSVATEFEALPHRLTYDLCRQYYQVLVEPPLRGVASGGQLSRLAMLLDVPMYATPTIALIQGALWGNGLGAGNSSAILANYSSSTRIEVDMNIASGTATTGDVIVLYSNSSTGGIFSLTSEL